MLVGALLADAAVIGLIAGVIDADWFSTTNFKRASSATILPVVALLLANLFPQEWRDRLAHMRWTYALPGHRAFTKHGPADTRIDMAAIEKKCGPLPTEPSEQNRAWYELYKEVGSEASVTQSHGRYLLFRDLAAMSFVLFTFSPTLAFAFDWHLAKSAALLFAAQTMLCVFTSRNSGIRFVTNVLSLHSAPSNLKPKAKPKKPSGTV